MVLPTLHKALSFLVLLFVTILVTNVAVAATATATVGQQVTFSVSAQGSAPFAYQWSKNGTAISGATNATYSINPVSTGSAGTYAVLVSNSAGSITAPGATLTVSSAVVAPAITTQPLSLSVTAGQSASFSVTASGTGPLTYQWYRNSVALPGATAATYAISVPALSHAGTYTVVVTNSAGSATSSGATLNVASAVISPTITTQPASTSVTVGQSASFSVAATGTAPLSYQWYKNSAAISGATSATYSIAATTLSNAGTYTVKVTNAAGSATSAGATLTVAAAQTAPVITQQPASLTVTTGKSATFSVSVSGTAPFTYTWRKNGTAISGATSASYTIASTTSTSAGNYSVVVKNAAGNVTSANATLTVQPANANGLVAAYNFNEGTGTTANDLSGNNNHGTLTGAGWTTSGKYRGALYFNGTSAMVTVKDSASLDLTSGMTVEAWICASTVGGGRDVLYKNSNSYYLVASSNTQNRPASGGSYAGSAVTGSYALSRNVWTHLAATYDGATMRLYVNGKLVSSRSQTGLMRTSSGALTIGGDLVAGRYFAGRIDDVRIYNRARTQAELQTDMATAVVSTAAASTTTLQTLALDTTDLAMTTDASGTDTSTTGTEETSDVAGPGMIASMSSRVTLPAGSNAAIASFVIPGTEPQAVLIRGCGPALAEFGVANPIASPLLRLLTGGTEIARNAGWTTTDADAIRAAAVATGAFALPEDGKDAALVQTLAPGTYTVRLSDKTGNGGVGLVEVYGLDLAGVVELPKLTARAVVGQGATVLASGVVVAGTERIHLLVRAIGPSLSSQQPVLSRPRLQLSSAAGAVIATNTGWTTAADPAGIVSGAQQVGASQLPAASGDSALVVTIDPGSYTLQVSSADDTSGLVQLEVYVLPAATP